jgi:hypothetical protein
MRPGSRRAIDPPGRPFTALDAILVLSSFLVGAAWSYECQPLILHLAGEQITRRFGDWRFVFSPIDRCSMIIRWSLPAVAALLAPPTLAILIARLRSPRPPLARCFRQPGTAACAVASIFLVLEVVNHFLNLTIRIGMPRLVQDLYNSGANDATEFASAHGFGALAVGLGETPGLAVAGAYLALWASGLWRPAPTWIDRAGRTLGWFWILAALVLIVFPLGD